MAQKQDRDHRQTLPSLAEGDEITKNLKRFASQRPDLADVQEQAPQPKKNVPIAIWDGQSNTLTRTHANVAMMQNQQR